MKPGEGIGAYYNLAAATEHATSLEELGALESDLYDLFSVEHTTRSVPFTAEMQQVFEVAESVVSGEVLDVPQPTAIISKPYDILSASEGDAFSKVLEMAGVEGKIPKPGQPEMGSHIVKVTTGPIDDDSEKGTKMKQEGYREKSLYFLTLCATNRIYSQVTPTNTRFALVSNHNDREEKLIEIKQNPNYGKIIMQHATIDGDDESRVLSKQGRVDNQKLIAEILAPDSIMYHDLLAEFRHAITELSKG